MDLSLHVPNSYLRVVVGAILGLFSTDFQLENKSFHFPWIGIYTAYVLESRLISMDGATQILISEFEARRWHNSKVCVWLVVQVWKFQSFLLATRCFMSVNNCSCSHINFGQTAVEGILILCCDLVSPLERG